MKFALLPFCAIAFAVLSIAQVALAHFELMTLDPVLLTVSAYSALIAAAIWLDRRSAQRVTSPTSPLDSNDTAAALAADGFDITNVVAFAPRKPRTGFVSDAATPMCMNLDDLATDRVITGYNGTGMTSSLPRGLPMKSNQTLIAAGWVAALDRSRKAARAVPAEEIHSGTVLTMDELTPWRRSLELTDENLANSGRLARLIRKQ